MPEGRLQRTRATLPADYVYRPTPPKVKKVKVLKGPRTFPRNTPADKLLIYCMRRYGMTIRSIANVMGIAEHQVNARLMSWWYRRGRLEVFDKPLDSDGQWSGGL